MGLQDNRVVVVTGASRGVGKGIALALGATGATVYVTGRSTQERDSPLPGTVHATADEITARGGKGVAVVCDHRDDGQVKALFDQVTRESGRLDILVNNVYAVPDTLIEPGGFWQKPLSIWDDMIDVGLRSHYVASYYAAPMMIAQKAGLIAFTSSFGARVYTHAAAYGVGKAGTDKMAMDMGIELKPHNVACLSLWLGLVKTERTNIVLEQSPEQYAALSDGIESPEYPGRVIDAVARDPDYMERSGRVWISAELGQAYGVKDIDGREPQSYRPMLGDPPEPSPIVIQ